MSYASNDAAGAPPAMKMFVGLLLFWSGWAMIYFTKDLALEMPKSATKVLESASSVFFFCIAPFSVYCAIISARLWKLTGDYMAVLSWYVSSASVGVVGYVTLRYFFGPFPPYFDAPGWMLLAALLLFIGHRSGTKAEV